MDELIFPGHVVNGIGQHAKLRVPGRFDISTAPEDWPETLFSGSLNIRIARFPDAFSARGLHPSTKALDTAAFEPAFQIPQESIGANSLGPTFAMPHRGAAQVWRATLNTGSVETPCWVLRRFGSGLDRHLELVAGTGLRAALGLARDIDWPATVRMFGRWRSPLT